MSLLTSRESKHYINIIAVDPTDQNKNKGMFRISVPEGTPEAIQRDYETPDKQKGTKWEIRHSKVEGTITNLAFWEGKFGELIHVTVGDNNESVTISLGTSSVYGEDFMKRLPNINLAKVVSFEPYCFENDEKKLIRGITIKQDGKKIENYYWDTEKKKSLHGGLPEPEGETEDYTKDDWRIHFLKVRKFLVEQTKKLALEKFPEVAEPGIEYPTEDSGKHIPF